MNSVSQVKNTPIVRKDKIGLKLKLIISSVDFRVLTRRKSVASYLKKGDNSILYQPMINMQLFQRNNKHTLSLRTLFIVMNYENILYWPKICNFQEAINVIWRYVRDVTHYTL